MKKCPGCGSLEADEDITCGVCGYYLRDISPMQESIDQSIEEDAAKETLGEIRFEKHDVNVARKEWIVGFVVGLSALILGFWLLFSGLSNYAGFSKLSDFGVLIGIYLIGFGMVTLETIFDLFEGAPYHGWGWFGWIGRR